MGSSFSHITNYA